jgi:hypothetical protein
MGWLERVKGHILRMDPEQQPKTGFMVSSRKEFIVFTVVLAIFFTFAYREYFGLGILNQGDLLPLFPKGGFYLNAFISSWGNSNLGFAGSATEAGFFNALLLFVFGDNSWLAQKIVFLATMPIACLSMFMFLDHHLTLGPEKSLISFIYGVNPVTIGLFFGGGIGLLTYYSIFPLLLLLLFNFLEGHKNSSISVVAFGMILAFGAAFDVQAPLFVLPFVIAFLISALITVRNHMKSLRIGASLLASFFIFSILTLPTTFNYFSSLVGYFNGSSRGAITNYAATSISHDILVSRIRDDFAFQTFDFLTGAIYLTSLMAIIALIVSNKRRLRYVLTLLVLLVAGIGFWQLGLNGSDLWLYNAIPLLFALSTLKLKMLFVQGFILLGAFLLEQARSRDILLASTRATSHEQMTYEL